MIINDLLYENNMSMYALSKKSGISNSTIRDICNGKTKLGKCTGDNLYKLSKVFDLTINELLDLEKKSERVNFDTFRSTTQHKLKNLGDIEFIRQLLATDTIQVYFDEKKYPEALYLLAMLDYLSRINNIQICTKYSKLRKCKLNKTLYPLSVSAMAMVKKTSYIKQEAIKKSIPEFIRFNIVECEVGNVV